MNDNTNPVQSKMPHPAPRTQGANSRDFHNERTEKEFEERVIEIKRVSRTVAGGKRMRFRALVVIGNRTGRIGMGLAKAGDVQGAIQKAVRAAKKHLVDVPIVEDTIPYEIRAKHGSTTLYLKPASAGTSVIAGGAVRTVLELAGIKNIISKIIGSTNKVNNVEATFELLKTMKKTRDSKMTPEPKVEDKNENEEE